MTEDPYWQWFEDSLKADSRAVGGEPCQVCGNEILRTAAWKHRDRHVCSSECNTKLIRRFKAKVKRGEIPGYGPPPDRLQIAAEESEREPRTFATRQDLEFPYEHSRWPVLGDIIERHGHSTAYLPLEALPYIHPLIDAVMEDAEIPEDRVLSVLHLETAAYTVWFTYPSGEPMRLGVGKVFFENDIVAENRETFSVGGQEIHCYREMISDVDDTGREFTWEAQVFSPTGPMVLWTPARQELSQQRRRISSRRASYLARMRAAGIFTEVAEQVDPIDVYRRDRWICGICNKPVDQSLSWPDPLSVTLDHIQPVARLGAHSLDNLQTAHWICNIRKGYR